MSKVLFNALMYEESGAGISVYTKKIIDQYIATNSLDVDCLVRKQYHDKYKDNEKVMFSKRPIYNSKDRILYEQITGINQYNKYDLIHFPDYAISLGSKAKKIITIQDMAMFTMKDTYTRKQVIVKQFLLRRALKQVDGIVCSSYYAKQELLKYFPKISEYKMRVIYPSITLPNPSIEEDEHQVLAKLSIVKPYILFVGTLAPSKNISSLIKAFELIKAKGQDVQLVICGKKGWMYKDLFEIYNKSIYKEDIIFTDFVTNETLEVLYKNARLFSSATLYEGFGFPPLEAMIRKVPVVVSDLEIFRETCGEAAYYYNSRDIENMADSLIRVLTDVKQQELLIEKGYARAYSFSTSNIAVQLCEFYDEILGREDAKSKIDKKRQLHTTDKRDIGL